MRSVKSNEEHRETTQKKKFWLLTWNTCSYDQYDQVLILAETKERAIEIAKKKYPGDEEKGYYGEANWKEGFTIKEITPMMEEGVIIDSYNAG